MVNKVIFTGYLDSEVHANDCFIEWLTLDGENLVGYLDQSNFDYPAEVRISLEVIKEETI